MDCTSPLHIIIDEAMNTVWSRSPRDFQREVITHLLQMRCFPNTSGALLLVQGTGCGKSSVAQTFGVVDAGIVLIIENTLALGADQSSKINSSSNTMGPVISIQLDSIRDSSQKSKVADTLMSLQEDTDSTIFLFASPETLLIQPWTTLMQTLKQRKIIHLVSIDEVHLFVSFGTTFRRQFTSLRDTLFHYMIDNNHPDNKSNCPHILHMPLLLMTATFNQRMVNTLEKMIGIKILAHTNYFWSGREGMMKRQVQIEFQNTPQYLRIIKEKVSSVLGDNLNKKAIIYLSTAASIDKMKESLDSWVDYDHPFQGDSVLVFGGQEPELKFGAACAFTKKVKDLMTLISANDFYPRVLIATSGCIGAGLDSDEVHVVLRMGFPCSISDFIQEMGRCGRNQHTNNDHPLVDCYHLITSLSDYVYLNVRLFVLEEPESEIQQETQLFSMEEQRKIQSADLLELLQFMVLDNGCWHVFLEDYSSNPLQPPLETTTNCNNACPFCLQTIHKVILPVNRQGVTDFLAETFINTPTGELTPSAICKKLQGYSDVWDKVYGKQIRTLV